MNPEPQRDAAPRDTPHPTLKNIAVVASLEHRALHERSRLDRLTDAITNAAGTPAFALGHATLFTLWISLNLTASHPFDPYPFSLLQLLVSMEAVTLSSFVLMTQSRMTRQADKRAHLDLQVNMLAEQELTAILAMLRALCERNGVTMTAPDPSVDQLMKETDIQELAVALERELTDTEGDEREAEGQRAKGKSSQRQKAR